MGSGDAIYAQLGTGLNLMIRTGAPKLAYEDHRKMHLYMFISKLYVTCA